MASYQELTDRHQKEVNAFPIGFAFDDKQFEQSMNKLGLTKHDTDKVYRIGGGGFIRKEDGPKLNDMTQKHNKEFQDAIDSDTTGEGFIKGMFDYELANHEYIVTYDIEDTLQAVNLTLTDIKANQSLSHGLSLALEKYV